MSALLRPSGSWDFVGQPRTRFDDLVEARATKLYAEYSVDPARISDTICEALHVSDTTFWTELNGTVHCSQGDKRGLPLIQLLLAGDDLAFCAGLRAEIDRVARDNAEHDARDDVLREDV